MVKKLIMLLALCFLFCGCTKEYKSVENYFDDMQKIQKEYSSYTVELEQKFQNSPLVYRHKSYIKGDKWRTEQYDQNGALLSVILCTGKEIYSYSPKEFILKKTNFDFKNPTDEEKIKELNPVNILFNWEKSPSQNTSFPFISEKAKFVNNKAKINNKKCRLIAYGQNREVCVSDKYGMSIYQKYILFNDNMPQSQTITTINVNSIERNNVKDSVFTLDVTQK